jgi:hypothetical protein
MDADTSPTLAHQVDIVWIAAKLTYVPSDPLQGHDHVLVPEVAGDNVVIGAQEACKSPTILLQPNLNIYYEFCLNSFML